MKLLKKTLIVLFLLSFLIHAQNNIIHKGNKYYFADRIIVKYKTQSLQKLKFNTLKKFGIIKSYNTFNVKEKSNKEAQELNKIYTLKYNSLFDPIYLVKKIKELPEIEWAEPYYLYELATEPNDPRFLDGTQNNLLQISAGQAWDINTGSDSIIIAIVDTGIDWDHPDLASNIWVNKNEIANNGVDDDNNGFIDDIRGWDFGGLDGTSDNDPNEDKADHGTHVAGIASAVTNNNIGIASIGYNCKLMAVKVSQDNIRSDNGSALIAYGYQGIIYAADNGAKVINCSWGGYGYSIASQEAINYAVSKGVLVVAAAGNENKSEPFYPASYKDVLSVASVNSSDVHSSFSNYGNDVDVSAPGEQIYSTWYDDTYTSLTGTSMASPLAAGLAALVTNEFPDFTPLQIAEQIRVNTDNIDNLNNNYKYKIGSGRINAVKSLSNKNSKSVRILNYTIYDGNDEIFESGDELTIEINFINYLAPTTNLTISILPQSSNISLVNGNFSAGSISTLESFNNSSNKFKVKINDNVPSNTTENILVQYSDGTYTDYEWITVNINPAYRTQKSDNLNLTITSKGSLGFDDFPNNSKGDGLTFKESNNLLFEGALMYGTSEKTIINSARNATAGASDNDFFTTTPFTIKIPGNLADEQGLTIFNDNNAGAGALKIETRLQTYSYSNPPNNNFIILEYNFYNRNSTTIDNFYAGIYTDFDMGISSDNDYASYNLEDNFGYVYDNEENPKNPVIGIALVNSENYGFFAMDIDGTNDSVSSYNGFSDLEKWKTLSSKIAYRSSGPSDISAVTAAGPFSISPGKKITVAFVFAGGDSLVEVSEAIRQSRTRYLTITNVKDINSKIPNKFILFQNYPNPFNPVTKIKYSLPVVATHKLSLQNVTLKVYDILGKEITTLVNKKQKPGNYTVEFDATKLSSGIYFYKLQYGNFLKTKKMIFLK